MRIYQAIIVEDEPMFVDLLKLYLAEIPGLHVAGTYGDTVGATLAIEKLKPDLLFLDINISGLEGPEFASLLEHKPQIIVISSHPESVMKDYELEIDAFLRKPITKEQLKRAVNVCIKKLG